MIAEIEPTAELHQRFSEPGANVIWCTGFRPSHSWIDLPVFGEDGDPMHERGVVPGEAGLYFVGLHFLSSMTSGTVTGVGRDAAYVAKAIGSRVGVGEVASPVRAG